MATPQEDPEFRVEILCSRHDRRNFSCGNKDLDRYLQTQARQDARKGVAVTFVLTEDGSTIGGYYALSQHSVSLDEIPLKIAKKLPKYPEVPVTLIGRFAVSSSLQGKGVGELMLMNALERCLGTSKQIASAAVIVDPKDKKSEGFYRKYGFLGLPGVRLRLFLPMKTIEAMVSV
ncbi:MAG: GNAT family N-acetyltransferase [Acidobacteriota bacterium]